MKRCTEKMRGCTVGIMILISLVAALPAFSQKKDLTYDLSLAQFRGTDSLNFVEFYFSIPLNQLVLVPKDEIFNLGFSISLQASKDDSVYARQETRHPYSTSGEEKEKQQSVLSSQNLYLPTGKFEIAVQVSDLFGDNSKKVTFPLTVRSIPEDSLYLSDIQLATAIQRETEKSQFYKNGYKVIPNVGNIFGFNLPALFYYSEIYNFTETPPGDSSEYVVRSRILDHENRVVKSNPDKVRKKPGLSAVELGRVSVVSLNSGTYIFEIEVQDLTSNQIYRREKKFFIYRPQDFTKAAETPRSGTSAAESAEAYPDSRYETMSEAEINKEFESAKYISMKDEQNTFKKLTLDAKRRFILEFWGRRDPDASTRRNEAREIYLSRVKYSNEQFSGFKDGWKTDRGRILLIYGEPDDIERSPFSSETKPYQIWHYYSVQGGIDFVLVDKRNFGDFELVHSTARGELNDPDWSRWIQTMDGN
jgi:GWxTD domain-containing protein